MGAYSYIRALFRKKQSETLRFQMRMRCWEYRHLNEVHRATRPSTPDKARMMGYKSKKGFVI
jgi:large subunit ribosomal protein L15e